MGLVAAGLALSAGVAYADDDTDVEGGRCEYGDASINIMPSCDTSNSDSGELSRELKELPDSLRQLPPTLESVGSAPEVR